MSPLLSTRDVAEILGASDDFVRDHARELGGIRLGGKHSPLRFDERGVRNFIDSRRLRAPDVTRSKARPGLSRRAGGVELLPIPEGM